MVTAFKYRTQCLIDGLFVHFWSGFWNDNSKLQWGSEIRPFEIRNHSKTGHFEDRLSRPFENRTFFSLDRFIYTEKIYLYIKRSRLVNHSKTGHFCPDFEWFSLDGFKYT